MTTGITRGPAAVGPYRLVRKLGEGGMGVVHLALDPAGQQVAIKVLRAQVATDAEARRRLTREVATLRRVRHSRVAEVLDADVVGDEPYLVTRFVPGRSLEQEVRAGGPLPSGQVARLGRSLAEAMGAIHAAGVVHRDIKPANVMMVDGDPVLIDFGIAHVADESRITRTGLVMGTPGYLAPELIYGDQVTAATDWWAWGATLVFAATGRQPFGSGRIEAILERVRTGKSDLSGIDPPLRDLLAATLTVDASRRPWAGALLAALDEVISGVTTAATQVDLPARTEVIAPGVAGPQDRSTVTPPPPRVTRNPGPAGSPATAVDPTKRLPPPSGYPAQAPQQAAPPAPLQAPRAYPGAGPYPGVAGPRPAVPYPMPGPYPPVGAYPPPAARSVAPQPPAARPSPGPYPAAGPYHPAAAYPSAPPGPHYVPGGVAPYAPVGPYAPPAAYPTAPGAPGAPEPEHPRRVTGSLLAVAIALAAIGSVAPGGAVVIGFAVSVLARTVYRSSSGLRRRRAELGRSRTDLAVTVAAVPWRLTMATLTSLGWLFFPVAAFLAAVYVGGSANSGSWAVTSSSPLVLALATVLGVATAWWGPGGRSLRNGGRSVVRSVSGGPTGRVSLLAGTVLLVLAALLVAADASFTPDWAPFPEPPFGVN